MSAEPSRHFPGIVYKRRKQKKLRVFALVVYGGQKKFELEASLNALDVVSFVHYHQSQRPADFLLPSLTKQEIKLLRRGDENAKLGIRFFLAQQFRFHVVDLKCRADSLDIDTERTHVPPQLSGNLIDQSARRHQIRHPAFVLVELVQGLQYSEFGNHGLATRSGQTYDDRPAARAEQSPFRQHLTLRG